MLAVILTASAEAQKVTTVAGGYVGDGKPATSASFAGLASLARDAKGNLYVSDAGHCRIRKINNKGTITKFAGTGFCGYSGDGGPAKSAMITAQGLAFDAQGNLLFADEGNSRIRRITAAGTISTIAGNGTFGYSGDGGPATQASLNGPLEISADLSGNVYIPDYGNCAVRMVDTEAIIHTVAGNHSCGFNGDGGPATSAQLGNVNSVLPDGNGNFYIADGSNYRVRKVDSTGTITTYAGNGSSGNGGNGGSATSAGIGSPSGLLLAGGKLYISTASNVWAVDLATQIINIVAGNANVIVGFDGDGRPALSTSFYFLRGMTFDATGNLLIADSGNQRIRKIDASQIVTTIAGGYIGDGGPATVASLNLSYFGGHAAFDSAGNLLIADTSNNRVRKVSPSGIISTLAGTGVMGSSGDGGPASSATLNAPTGVTADRNGNVFISHGGGTGVIRKVDSSGTITTFSKVLPGATGLATDATGNVYVAGFWSSVVWKITPSGSASIVAGMLYQSGYNGDGIPATQANLTFPVGVAVDQAGNLYIAEWLGNRIRKVDPNGIISTVAGNGVPGFSGDGGPGSAAMLAFPLQVGADAKGNVYIADSSNGRVRMINSSGTINTLAGSGGFGYNGNGLPATSTNIFPTSVNVSPKGFVYITDSGSYRVRKIH